MTEEKNDREKKESYEKPKPPFERNSAIPKLRE